MLFNLTYMTVSKVKSFWRYEGRKVGHLALDELPLYREYAHGPSIFRAQTCDKVGTQYQ